MKSNSDHHVSQNRRQQQNSHLWRLLLATYVSCDYYWLMSWDKKSVMLKILFKFYNLFTQNHLTDRSDLSQHCPVVCALSEVASANQLSRIIQFAANTVISSSQENCFCKKTPARVPNNTLWSSACRSCDFISTSRLSQLPYVVPSAHDREAFVVVFLTAPRTRRQGRKAKRRRVRLRIHRQP